jgi:hypothetical protein
MAQTYNTPLVPIALLPDGVVAVGRRLRLPERLRRRLRHEAALRRGSDRSGPRVRISTAAWLLSLEAP